jgi:general stress protein 26
MDHAADRREIWDLIKHEHVAVLVTVAKDGSLDSRPMGCVQNGFDGTLWFMTFKGMPKLLEIEENQQALVSYAHPSKYEFISLSGHARTVDDRNLQRELWREGLRVWFPEGPNARNMALVAVDVETARIWTKPASMLSYGYYYLRARLSGKAPRPQEVAEIKTLRLKEDQSTEQLYPQA